MERSEIVTNVVPIITRECRDNGFTYDWRIEPGDGGILVYINKDGVQAGGLILPFKELSYSNYMEGYICNALSNAFRKIRDEVLRGYQHIKVLEDGVTSKVAAVVGLNNSELLVQKINRSGKEEVVHLFNSGILDIEMSKQDILNTLREVIEFIEGG